MRFGRLFGAKNEFYALGDVGFPGIGCAHDYVGATLKIVQRKFCSRR